MNHLPFIAFISYAICEGFLWAGIFGHNTGVYMKANQPYNVHLFISPVRVIFISLLLIVAVPCNVGHSFFFFVYQIIAMLLVFPFWHNGTYYEMRRLLEPKTLEHYRFWSTSKTTTAKLNFNFPIRSVLFLCGMLMEGLRGNVFAL